VVLCCVFLCVLDVASYFGLSNFECPFSFLSRLFQQTVDIGINRNPLLTKLSENRSYMYDILSLNMTCDYVGHIYSIDLEIKDTTDTSRSLTLTYTSKLTVRFS